jgi:hypothetical protein
MEKILQQMSQRAKSLGHIKGQSAEDWRKLDPEAALKFAQFLRENHTAIVRGIASVIVK